jgi:hypothetical protein
MTILHTLAGGFGSYHGSLQVAKTCTHRHHTITVGRVYQMDATPSKHTHTHRRSLRPAANYILVNRTFNHYSSNPDGPIQPPSTLPVLSSIQAQVHGPYIEWMSSPFNPSSESWNTTRGGLPSSSGRWLSRTHTPLTTLLYPCQWWHTLSPTFCTVITHQGSTKVI